MTFLSTSARRQVGDPEHSEMFAKVDGREECFEESDREGVAL
jgi:hypothetical protein